MAVTGATEHEHVHKDAALGRWFNRNKTSGGHTLTQGRRESPRGHITGILCVVFSLPLLIRDLGFKLFSCDYKRTVQQSRQKAPVFHTQRISLAILKRRMNSFTFFNSQIKSYYLNASFGNFT